MQIFAKEKNEMEKQRLNTNAGRLLCPFIRKPFEDCYCASTSSLYTEATIHYCGGRFEECDIYEKHMRMEGLGT